MTKNSPTTHPIRPLMQLISHSSSWTAFALVLFSSNRISSRTVVCFVCTFVCAFHLYISWMNGDISTKLVEINHQHVKWKWWHWEGDWFKGQGHDQTKWSKKPEASTTARRVLSIVSVIFTWTWLRYVRVFAVANPSVVCKCSCALLRGWNFRQYFFAILYLSHPLTSVQKLLKNVVQVKMSVREIVPGEPLRQGR